jgi:hypothetical protein
MRIGHLEKRSCNGWRKRQATLVVLRKAVPPCVDQSWKVSWAPHMVPRSYIAVLPRACLPGQRLRAPTIIRIMPRIRPYLFKKSIFTIVAKVFCYHTWELLGLSFFWVVRFYKGTFFFVKSWLNFGLFTGLGHLGDRFLPIDHIKPV